MNSPSESRGTAMVIASAVLFGLMPLLTKIAYAGGCGTCTVVFGRFAFGAAASALAAALGGHRLFDLSARELRRLLVLSALYAATPVLLYGSYRHIGTGLATTLHFTYPVTVMLLDIRLFHARADRRFVLCLCVCAAGLLCLCGPGEGGGPRGVALAALSGVSYAVYILLLGKSGLRRVPVTVITFWLSLFSAGEIGLLSALTGSLTVPQGPAAWAAVAGLGVLSTTLAVALFQAGVFLCGEVKASLLSTFEPLTGTVLGVLVFHEAVTPRSLAGAGLILLSVVLLVRPRTQTGR